MLILLVCGVHLEKKRRPQYPWAQGLSPPCTKGSPRELLKRVSVWVSPLRDSYSTWAGLWSYCFKSSPDDSTGKSGLKTTTMLCTVFFKPDLKSSAQSPEPPADVTQPYSLNHLARPSQLFFPPGLSRVVESARSTAPLSLPLMLNPTDPEPASVLLSHLGAAGERDFPRAIDSPGTHEVAISSLIKTFTMSHWYWANSSAP